MLRTLLACVALLSAGIAVEADAADYVKVEVVASTVEPAAGEATLLGFRMVPKPGWHTYWSNPGESGLAPTVTWEAPEGVSFGALRHPAPSLLKVLGTTSFVHAGEHTLIAPMRLPAALEQGAPIPVVAKLNWLACSESLCVPQRATFRLDLIVGGGKPSASAEMLSRAQKLLPKKIGSGEFYLEGGYLRLRLPAAANVDARFARFFPDQNDVIEVAGQRPQRQDTVVELSAAAGARRVSQLSGVLTDGRAAYRLLFKSAVQTPHSRPAAKTKAPTKASLEPEGRAEELPAPDRRYAPPAPAPRTAAASALFLLIAISAVGLVAMLVGFRTWRSHRCPPL